MGAAELVTPPVYVCATVLHNGVHYTVQLTWDERLRRWDLISIGPAATAWVTVAVYEEACAMAAALVASMREEAT